METTAFVSLEVTYSVDPAILGGLVIRIGDRVVDSSIRTRLGEIRRDLMKLQLGVIPADPGPETAVRQQK